MVSTVWIVVHASVAAILAPDAAQAVFLRGKVALSAEGESGHPTMSLISSAFSRAVDASIEAMISGQPANFNQAVKDGVDALDLKTALATAKLPADVMKLLAAAGVGAPKKDQEQKKQEPEKAQIVGVDQAVKLAKQTADPPKEPEGTLIKEELPAICAEFFSDDCGTTVPVNNVQVVGDEFESCCRKGGHHNDTCESITKEMFSDHADVSTDLCLELVTAYDLHQHWKDDQRFLRLSKNETFAALLQHAHAQRDNYANVDEAVVNKGTKNKGLPTPAPPALTYIKASDRETYIHATGGTGSGNELTMHSCPKAGNYPNCQWVLEPSTTRIGMYYIKASDRETYIHASGGTGDGNALTMHSCAKAYDYPNCQWVLEPSTTRTGMYYIKASDRETYIHASGGTGDGNELTMHSCPKAYNYPNCQWSMTVPQA